MDRSRLEVSGIVLCTVSLPPMWASKISASVMLAAALIEVSIDMRVSLKVLNEEEARKRTKMSLGLESWVHTSSCRTLFLRLAVRVPARGGG